MKPGMKPDNFQQIYVKGMKPGMKPRYETGLSEKRKRTYLNFELPGKWMLDPQEDGRHDAKRYCPQKLKWYPLPQNKTNTVVGHKRIGPMFTAKKKKGALN